MRKKQIKPAKVDRKLRRYSPEIMCKAYEAVMQKKLSVKRAAREFAVPETTLRDRVCGRIDAYHFSNGGETTLTNEEEEPLVEYVEAMSLLGYGVTNNKLQHLAGDIAFDMGKKKKNKPMSNQWLYGFLRRWKTRLTSLSPRSLDSNRAKYSTPEAIANYFENLNDIMEKYDLLDKPEHIYNLDETGLQPEHRPPNIISSVQCKAQAVVSPRSTTTTLIGCINAIGHTLPPFFIFKGKRYNDDLMKGACAGAKCEMSDSGWSNGEIFKKYLKEHFLPLARYGHNLSQPILLILDGHTSHTSPSLLEWARTQNLILFVLPAHTSHILQPLDVSVFGPFKNFYYSECSSFMQNNFGKTISRYEMCSLACKAFLRAMTPLNIQSGFRKTGIYPICSNAVPMEALFPAECFREDNPIDKIKAMKNGREAVETFLSAKMEHNSKTTTEETLCSKCSCKNVKKVKKPRTSGRAITEDLYIQELSQYETDRNEMKNTTCIDKTPKKKKPTKLPKKTLTYSPKPSTSGMAVINLDPIDDPASSSDTDYEEEIPEDEMCCVCKRWSPPNQNDFPNLKIINWAYCDKCSHCVHLTFCTKVRVVRRHSEFLCPCCEV